MEKLDIKLELKALDTSKRTAVIRHAVYNSIDRAGDVAHKGMFTKSWNEGLPDFRFNHNKEKRPGKALRVFDDNEGAYTEVKFANTTTGNDVLEMASEDMLTGASFGYIAEKKDFSTIKNKRIRNLREVDHIETSLLDVMPCHPEAGIITLNKAFEDEDPSALLQWNDEQIQSMKGYVEQLDKYCRKAKASDDTIQALQKHLIEYKQIISDYDTAITQLATEPVASEDEMKLSNFLTSLKIERWNSKNN